MRELYRPIDTSLITQLLVWILLLAMCLQTVSTGSAAAQEDASTLALPVGNAGDETLMVSLPQRPFSALARLPDAVVKGLLSKSGGQLHNC